MQTLRYSAANMLVLSIRLVTNKQAKTYSAIQGKQQKQAPANLRSGRYPFPSGNSVDYAL